MTETRETPNDLRHPFGEVSCEEEVRVFKDQYSKYYFFDVPFNRESIETSTYLIVGRRGSGKTSLSRFFSFQPFLKNARCIDVDEPDFYNLFMNKLAHQPTLPNEIAIPRVAKIWTYLIWLLIFQEYRDEDHAIKRAAVLASEERSRPSQLIRSVLKKLIDKFLGDNQGELGLDLEEYLAGPIVEAAKKAIAAITRRKPVIVAIDALEHYSIDNAAMMRSMAALISCANRFNNDWGGRGFTSNYSFPERCFRTYGKTWSRTPAKR